MKLNRINMKLNQKLFIFLIIFVLLISILKNWNNYPLYYEFYSFDNNLIEQNSEFYLNPKWRLCNPYKNKLLLVAFVIIAPEHFDKRNLIRQTWGNNSLAPNDFKLIFTIGKSANLTVNEKIIEEFKIHKDILQLNNFTDSYFNMTTKIMKSFNWISKYCTNAQYVLRCNDDVLVNVFSLINYFKNITYKSNQIYGRRLRKTVPIRSIYHKHYVSVKQFPRDYYPDYPEGM